NLALNLPIEAQRENLIQRLRRALGNRSCASDTLYRPIRQHLFAHWNLREVCLVMDRTDIENRWSLLLLGASYKKRVLPLTWQMLPYGSSSASEQMDLLWKVKKDLPAGVRVHFYGDCEFRPVEVQRLCRQFRWHYQVGVKSDTYFRSPPGEWQLLSSLGLGAGERRYLEGCYLSKQHDYGPLNVIADWSKQQESPRYWAMDLAANMQAWRRGRKRYYIEPSFRDWKSYGFDLEGSKIEDQDRLEVLLLGMAITDVWMIAVGDWLTGNGAKTIIAPAEKEEYSLFRMGRDYVQRCRVMGWRVPIRFEVGRRVEGVGFPWPIETGRGDALSAAA
ncbi:MAG: transposase, partial [Burkholderiales bacterium]